MSNQVAQRQQPQRSHYTWINFIAAAATVNEAIDRINDAYRAGQIAGNTYNRLIETAQRAGNGATRIYGQIQNSLRQVYHEGYVAYHRGQASFDSEIARRRRQLPAPTVQGQTQITDYTNQPRQAPVVRNNRRNPATMDPNNQVTTQQPNPTPTPATAQPSTGKSSFFNLQWN